MCKKKKKTNRITIKLNDRKGFYLSKHHQNITINYSLLLSSADFCGIITLPIHSGNTILSNGNNISGL
jgi:hypothetical protein